IVALVVALQHQAPAPRDEDAVNICGTPDDELIEFRLEVASNSRVGERDGLPLGCRCGARAALRQECGGTGQKRAAIKRGHWASRSLQFQLRGPHQAQKNVTWRRPWRSSSS